MRLSPHNLDPGFFLPNPSSRQKSRDYCREILKNFSEYLGRGQFDTYNIRRIESSAFTLAPLILESGLNLADATALELGCGAGMKAIGLAGLFKAYVGVDLDHTAITQAKTVAADLGITNLTFLAENAADVLAEPERYGLPKKVDVLILFAVMEHLTQDERIAVFEMARTLYKNGGSIILLETPNRLNTFDHHSSHLHFVQSLPDELAIRYILAKSEHPGAKSFVIGPGSIDSPPSRESIVGLHRLGRGLSYHDFELFFYEDENDFAPAADGFHPLLLNHQPFTNTEHSLESYFAGNGLPIHRLFSRAWIDMILVPGAKGAVSRRATFLRPEDRGLMIDRRPQFWTLDTFTAKFNQSLRFNVPLADHDQTLCVIVDEAPDNSTFVVKVDDVPIMQISNSFLREVRIPMWHKIYSIPVSVPPGSTVVSLEPAPSSVAKCQGALLI